MDDASKTMAAPLFVLFPDLETGVAPGIFEEMAKALRRLGARVWIADERDRTLRLRAIHLRELYRIGRSASILVLNPDGLRLDGWYGQLPTVDELAARMKALAPMQAT